MARPLPPPVAVGQRGIVVGDFDVLWRLACCIKDSGLAPKGIQTTAAIAVAIQMLVENSGLLLDFDEWYELADGEKVDSLPEKPGPEAAAVCCSHRRGRQRPRVTRFSVGDAMKARLWGKEGPWTFYPGRMLRFRARGFNLRDNFPDVLKGFKTTEELQDYPEEPARREVAHKPAPPVIEAQPVPATKLEQLAAKLPSPKPQPQVEAGADADSYQDFTDQFDAALKAAKSEGDWSAITADLVRNRDWLGARYDGLLSMQRDAYKQWKERAK